MIVDAQTASHEIFADLRVVQEAWGTEAFTIYDCWAKHDLGSIGFKHLWTTPWYVRPPSKLAVSGATTGLTVESVSSASQLADFEEATVEGFEMVEAEGLERFSQHAPATLDDPGMVYLNARLDGQVVATAPSSISQTTWWASMVSLPCHVSADVATPRLWWALLRPCDPTCR